VSSRTGEVRVQEAEQRQNLAAERPGVEGVGRAQGRRAADERRPASRVRRVSDGGELRVRRVEGGLDGPARRLEPRQRAGLHADVLGGGEDERLPAGCVDVLGEELLLW